MAALVIVGRRDQRSDFRDVLGVFHAPFLRAVHRRQYHFGISHRLVAAAEAERQAWADLHADNGLAICRDDFAASGADQSHLIHLPLLQPGRDGVISDLGMRARFQLQRFDEFAFEILVQFDDV